jgi:hypothetical protein
MENSKLMLLMSSLDVSSTIICWSLFGCRYGICISAVCFATKFFVCCFYEE